MKKLALILILAILLSVPAAAADIPMESEPDENVPATVFDEEPAPATAQEIDIPAPSAILIEKETGTVIFEKNADERLEPASVTKVMTILLIVEAVENGTVSLDDTVTTSARAASMGGSQVYLEEGEQMSLGEMLKCIVVSSANDAAVAVAEHIAGSEQAFVSMMNERAAELNMVNTNFTNCTGLMDDPDHLTTARDISLMSRELILHEWIKEYTTIWMDTIRDGTFGLSNTNKLIRYYSGATGLKTGYTSSAGHCLAATAQRDGVEYIAVVLNCKSSADRFESAKTLLSFGFAAYTLTVPYPDEVLPPIPVTLGESDFVQPVLANTAPILVKKTDLQSIEKHIELTESLTAPVSAGQKLGTLTVTCNGETVVVTDIIAGDNVEKLNWWDICCRMFSYLFFGG